MTPLERPLPQLAAGEQREEAPLLGRRAREERRERRPPHGGRAGSARRLDRRERAVDLGDPSDGAAAGAGRVAQRSPADAGPALSQLAREVADDDRDLARLRAAQAVRERGDLGEPRAGRRDGGGGGDEVGEQHVRILARVLVRGG